MSWRTIVGLILLIFWSILLILGSIFIKYFMNSYLVFFLILFFVLEMGLIFLSIYFINYDIIHAPISYPYNGP